MDLGSVDQRLASDSRPIQDHFEKDLHQDPFQITSKKGSRSDPFQITSEKKDLDQDQDP